MSTFAGHERLSVFSKDLNVHYPVAVFYPTLSASTLINVGPFEFEASAQAPVLEGQFPLVILSHGSGGSPYLYRDLAIGLARAQFVVAAPEHPFNNRVDNSLTDTLENLTQRPKQISEVIDSVFAHAKLRGHILPSSVSVIGHSMGGYAALAAAGGVPHTKHQIAYNPNGKLKVSTGIDLKKDVRIGRLILLAPAARWFLSAGALDEVSASIHIIAAQLDELTSIKHSELIMTSATNAASLSLHVAPGAGHFSFLTSFPEKMRNPRFPPAMDPPGFDRDRFQQELLIEVLNTLSLDRLNK